MKAIETPDLKIIALDFRQLLSYIEQNKLEKELGLALNERVVSEKVKTRITEQILPKIEQDKPENIFSTIWIIIDKPENEIAAEFCFKGEPRNGKTEIGYATFSKFQNKGIMTRALQEIAHWTFKNTTINAILAQTDPENIASVKVLKKSLFNLIQTEEENLVWQRNR